MKVLVIGGGGREHALAWKLSLGASVEKVYCAPGNPGIAEVAELVDIDEMDFEALADFALRNGVDLAVVGPEAPLCGGVADVFAARGIRVFGPSKAAATLEGSKTFAKEFMARHGIPTADFAVFEREAPALDYVRSRFAAGVAGLVVKADGLAAGKGVAVASEEGAAAAAVKECFEGRFGSAGAKVLVEEMLVGEEASILAFTDGHTIVPLASSQDHKRLLDGDGGPNTGGMGAYSPAPVVDERMEKLVGELVLARFLQGIKADGLDYRGVIYAGIMATADGPKVLEFNVRFGDPETQAVLPRLEGDLGAAMAMTADRRLDEVELRWTPGTAVCVVMASGGYPGSYDKGLPIAGLTEAAATGAMVFHAGTAARKGKIVNAGGRVLGITALGDDIGTAIAKSYAAVAKISWPGAIHRKDIAWRAAGRRATD